MSRIKLALAVVEDLKQLAGSIETLAKAMQEGEATVPEANVVAKPALPAKEVVTIEAVRAVLAAKSQSGKQAAVKALISKFGANKLTEVEAAKYAELLAEAEVL